MAKKKKKSNKPLVLIMAGGKGERFWPRSTERNPKQLQKIYSKKTLLQETIDRARLFTSKDRIYIGCNRELKKAVMRTHNVSAKNFIVEPEGRNTAPIVALAAAELIKKNPESSMVVLSADHYITPPDVFKKTIQTALIAAEQGNLVTLGVKPSRPDSGYGYIKPGEVLSDGVHKVESFKEKPDPQTAVEYLNEGYLWNSGIFIWKLSVILQEFHTHAPGIIEPIEKALKDKKLKKVFAKIPKEPIDIAIMEKSKAACVVPADFTWDDVGAWTALDRIVEKNGENIVLSERKKADLAELKAQNNTILSEKKLIALLGIENVVVVEQDDILFIASKDGLSDIKELTGKMRSNPALQKYLK